MLNRYRRLVRVLNNGQDLSLLFLRLLLAYGFWDTAKTKWDDIDSVAEWFYGLGIVAPKFNAYFAASVEMAGVFLLLFGLGTRLISIPLIITLIVAIKTVHWENGFASGNNGYEIALYYILMLFVLTCFGAGKLSIDYLIQKKTNRKL
jgi:putative oxidoreductase